MAKKITATIVVKGRTKDISVGVNGEVKKFPVNQPVILEPYQKEALENAGYQLVVQGDKSTAGAEGSASAVDQGPDNNRTDPHQFPNDPSQQGDVIEGGAGARDANGAPIIKGGDEPNPLVHKVTGDGITAGSDPLDGDGNGERGGSAPHDPPALTGKTTAQLEQIAADEGVTLGDDVKTNADRIEAIEKARSAKA